MTYGDFIVLAIVVAFILLRYRAMLGEPRGREGGRVMPIAEFERIVQLPKAAPAQVAAKKDDDFSAYGAFAPSFVAMRAIDRGFTPDEFLQGARTAYEMVIAAFTKRDRETLKLLLSPERFTSFDAALAEAEREGRFNDTTLVAITEAKVSAASLTGNAARITVDFASEQIHLVRDAAGAVVEGNPSYASPVVDRWVFTRTLTSSSPNWTILET